MSKKTNSPTIIRRVEEIHEAGHHGGGWKVAYADFMTAMMAFFLLLWILAASDEEKLRGLANYFTPTVSKEGTAAGSGSDIRPLVAPGAMRDGGPGEAGALGPSFGTTSPMRVFDSRLRDEPNTVVVEYAPEPKDEAVEAVEAAVTAVEPPTVSEDSLERMAKSIEDKLGAINLSDDLAESVRVKAEEGALVVEIVDLERRSMFARGSSEISAAARDIIKAIGESVSSMSGTIEIVGHTDATQFAPDIFASRSDVDADDILDLVARLRSQSDHITPNVVQDEAREEGPTLTPVIPVEKAFTQSQVFCLCCGRGFKMLKRHLGAEHGMTEAEYRTAFSLPESVPLVAPDYSERKAAYARQAGLGTHARDASATEKTLP